MDEDEDEDGDAGGHGIAPASAEGGFIDSSGLMTATTESERQQLQGVVAQIAAATDGLASMLEAGGARAPGGSDDSGGGESSASRAAAVEVGNPLGGGGGGGTGGSGLPLGLRDAFDREVHQVMWLVDMAVRVVKGAEPLDAHHHGRLR